MAKSTRKGRRARQETPELFGASRRRFRRSLILPATLEAEAEKAIYRGDDQDRAHEILIRWADLELDGHLDKKETALDASFLHEVFGNALGYSTATESPERYTLERNYGVAGVGSQTAHWGSLNLPITTRRSRPSSSKGRWRTSTSTASTVGPRRSNVGIT